MEKIKIECDCCKRYIYIERKNGEYRCSYCDNIIKFELLKGKEKMETIRARISDDLKKDIEILEKKLKSEAQKGAEVTTSSILRGAIENFIDEHKENTVTIKLDTKYLNENEISLIEEFLVNLKNEMKGRIKQQLSLDKESKELYKLCSHLTILINKLSLIKFFNRKRIIK